MEELMLRINNVSKMYKLGQIGGTTLRDELQRLNARIHGREDPTKRIGARDYNKGETFMALDDVSFDVKKGERVGIIGHNGAGKSTLLKLISRVTAPTGGSIGLNGRVASMLEVGTGFHGELTGRENIYMNGAILGMTKKEIDDKIENIIEFSECRQFIDTPVKRYSSGMYVKLAFSVAAHLDSEIMIMDEVLAVGDMAFQKKCLDKMSDVSKTEGRTILYVSHNMNTIRELCDRVIVLDHGKVVFDGDVEEGIAVYIGKNVEGAYTHYELENLKRPGLLGTIHRLRVLDFLNKDKAEYDNRERIELNLQFQAQREQDGLFIAEVVKKADNTTICVSGLSQEFSFAKGDNKLHVKIPIDLLEEDFYRLHLELITFDEYGSYLTYDNPFVSFPFKVEKKTDRYIWPKQYYGNVREQGVSAERIS